jgi:16S rRNA (guanine527-N7)-methyltransferase
MPDAEQASALRGVLEEAARLGFLGPGDVDAAIEHARGFAGVLRPAQGRVVDLGSGAGLPGLVLAVDLPELAVTLVDASERRTDALRRAVGRLGLSGRVEVVCERAEVLGRSPAWRSTSPVVVARSFGAPAVVAECAAPLLRVGGQLVVSEPPAEDPGRWPADGLALVGLVRDDPPVPAAAAGGRGRYASFTLVSLCPDRYPRASQRRLLFGDAAR